MTGRGICQRGQARLLLEADDGVQAAFRAAMAMALAIISVG
jgi:hypothetical protein